MFARKARFFDPLLPPFFFLAYNTVRPPFLQSHHNPRFMLETVCFTPRWLPGHRVFFGGRANLMAMALVFFVSIFGVAGMIFIIALMIEDGTFWALPLPIIGIWLFYKIWKKYFFDK